MSVYLTDANFLVALINPSDKFHLSATNLYNELVNHNPNIVIPDIVLKETMFALTKAGLNIQDVLSKVTRFTMRPSVIIAGVDSLSMLRFCSESYNHLVLADRNKSPIITKTNDYLIACTALDHNATVISNDNQMVKCLTANGVSCLNFVASP